MEKISKTIPERKRLWGYYVKDKKGFKNFEAYCEGFVKMVGAIEVR